MAAIAAAASSLLAQLTVTSVLKFTGQKAGAAIATQFGKLIFSSVFPESATELDKDSKEQLKKIFDQGQKVLGETKEIAATLKMLNGKLDAVAQQMITDLGKTLMAAQQLVYIKAARNRIHNVLQTLADAANDSDASTYWNEIADINKPGDDSIPNVLRNMHRALFDEPFTFGEPILPYLLRTFSTKLENTSEHLDYSIFSFIDDADRWLRMLSSIDALGVSLIVANYFWRSSKGFNKVAAILRTEKNSQDRIEAWIRLFFDYIQSRPAFAVLYADAEFQRSNTSPQMHILQCCESTPNGDKYSDESVYLLGSSAITPTKREVPLQGYFVELRIRPDGKWEIWAFRNSAWVTVSSEYFSSHTENPYSFKFIPQLPPASQPQAKVFCVAPVALYKNVVKFALGPRMPSSFDSHSSIHTYLKRAEAYDERWGLCTLDLADAPNLILVPFSSKPEGFWWRTPAGTGTSISAFNYPAFVGQPYYFSASPSHGGKGTYGDPLVPGVTLLALQVWDVPELVQATTLENRQRVFTEISNFSRGNFTILRPLRATHISSLVVCWYLAANKSPDKSDALTLLEFSPTDAIDLAQDANTYMNHQNKFLVGGQKTRTWNGSVVLDAEITFDKGGEPIIVPKGVAPAAAPATATIKIQMKTRI